MLEKLHQGEALVNMLVKDFCRELGKIKSPLCSANQMKEHMEVCA